MKNTNFKTLMALILFISAGIFFGCSGKTETAVESNRKENSNQAANANLTSYFPPPTPENVKTPMNAAENPKTNESGGGSSRSTSAISKANFEKIKEGMTLQEVEKILGGEGLNVATKIVNGRQTETFKWTSDNFTTYIDVVFEKNKMVEKKEKGLS